MKNKSGMGMVAALAAAMAVVLGGAFETRGDYYWPDIDGNTNEACDSLSNFSGVLGCFNSMNSLEGGYTLKDGSSNYNPISHLSTEVSDWKVRLVGNNAATKAQAKDSVTRKLKEIVETWKEKKYVSYYKHYDSLGLIIYDWTPGEKSAEGKYPCPAINPITKNPETVDDRCGDSLASWTHPEETRVDVYYQKFGGWGKYYAAMGGKVGNDSVGLMYGSIFVEPKPFKGIVDFGGERCLTYQRQRELGSGDDSTEAEKSYMGCNEQTVSSNKNKARTVKFNIWTNGITIDSVANIKTKQKDGSNAAGITGRYTASTPHNRLNNEPLTYGALTLTINKDTDFLGDNESKDTTFYVYLAEEEPLPFILKLTKEDNTGLVKIKETSPKDTTVIQGRITNAKLSVELDSVRGLSDTTYQWYYQSSLSSTMSKMDGRTKDTMIIPSTLTSGNSPYYFRVVVGGSNVDEPDTSRVASVTVANTLKFNAPPNSDADSLRAYSYSGNDSAVVTSGVTGVLYNSKVTFKVYPKINHHVVNWKVNDNIMNGQTQNTYEYTVKGNDSISVELGSTASKYKLTFNKPDNATSLTAVDLYNGTVTSGVTEIPANNKVTFTVTPSIGYRVSAWKVGNNVVATFGNAYEHTVNANATISVELEPVYKLKFANPANGTLTAVLKGGGVNDSVFSNSTEISGNAVVVFNVTPQTDYRVIAWKVGGNVTATSGNTYEHTTTKNDSISVDLAKSAAKYKLTFTPKPNGADSVEALVLGVGYASTGDSIAADSTVKFTVRPKNDYHVVAWKFGTTENNLAAVAGQTGNVYNHKMTSDAVVGVDLAADSVTITFNPNGGTSGTLTARKIQNVTGGGTLASIPSGSDADPTKTDSTFGGWFLAQTPTPPTSIVTVFGDSVTTSTKFTKDTTAYAKWVAISPKITITKQPVTSKTVVLGHIYDSLTIAATLNKTGTLSYQWYSNTVRDSTSGTAVNTATDTVFIIPDTLAAGTYYYYAVVSAAAAGAAACTSNVATVTVTGSPQITIKTQPKNETVTAGSTVNLTVEATVVPPNTPLSYQWYKAANAAVRNTDTLVSGAARDTFAVPTNLAVGSHYYYVKVWANGADTVTSGVATVTVNTAPIPVTSITIDGGSVVVVGSTLDLRINYTPEEAATADYTVAWSSSDPSKATVSGSGGINGTGAVAGVSAGSVNITAKIWKTGAGASDTIRSAAFPVAVSAVPVPVTAISVTGADRVAAGSTITLGYTLAPSNATDIQDYVNKSWASSNNSVATVNNDGVVTGVSAGNVDITVSVWKNGQQSVALTASREVAVSSTITINTQPAANTTVIAGSITGSLSVVASITPATTLEYQWYNAENKSATGKVTAVTGANTAAFEIPKNLTTGTYYYYVVVSSYGAADVKSEVATVAVNPFLITVSELKPFIPMVVDYPHPPSAQTVTVANNTGNSVVNLAMAATDDTFAFDVTPPSKTSLNTNESTTFTVRPKLELAPKLYEMNITVSGISGSHRVSVPLKASFRVTSEPTYDISASTLSSFGSLHTPYKQPLAQVVVVTNIGTDPVILSQPSAADYVIGPLSATNLAAGAMATFNVRPKADLEVGDHEETIDITGSDGANTKITARFVVEPAWTYAISASPLSSFGYLATQDALWPAAQTVTITNDSTGEITLTQPKATKYLIGTLSTKKLEKQGDIATFTVQPKKGLGMGSHDETITISGSNGTNVVSVTVEAMFTVASEPIYTVIFDPNGGTVTPESGATGVGRRLSFLPTPKREGYLFNGWFTDVTEGTRITTGTAFENDAVIYAIWTPVTEESGTHETVTFSAGANGTLTASVDGAPITTGASVPRGKDVVFTATPTGGYNIVRWTINGVVDVNNTEWTYTIVGLSKTVTVTATFDREVSVASNERVIPVTKVEESATIAPVAAFTAQLTAGPNPAVKPGAVSFYRHGSRVAYATLSIYDASGNVVKKIRVIDDALGNQLKRKVSTWNLRDSKGRLVPEGTYLVKGVIKTSGNKRERVSIVVGVVR